MAVLAPQQEDFPRWYQDFGLVLPLALAPVQAVVVVCRQRRRRGAADDGSDPDRHARSGDGTPRCRVSDCATLDEARNAAQTGVARVPWEVVDTSGEQDLATGGLTVRCLQLGDGSLPETDDDAGALAYIARAY